jgi:hypothetical protein
MSKAIRPMIEHKRDKYRKIVKSVPRLSLAYANTIYGSSVDLISRDVCFSKS